MILEIIANFASIGGLIFAYEIYCRQSYYEKTRLWNRIFGKMDSIMFRLHNYFYHLKRGTDQDIEKKINELRMEFWECKYEKNASLCQLIYNLYNFADNIIKETLELKNQAYCEFHNNGKISETLVVRINELFDKYQKYTFKKPLYYGIFVLLRRFLARLGWYLHCKFFRLENFPTERFLIMEKI